jgi:hypothetical protein
MSRELQPAFPRRGSGSSESRERRAYGRSRSRRMGERTPKRSIHPRLMRFQVQPNPACCTSIKATTVKDTPTGI